MHKRAHPMEAYLRTFCDLTDHSAASSGLRDRPRSLFPMCERRGPSQSVRPRARGRVADAQYRPGRCACTGRRRPGIRWWSFPVCRCGNPPHSSWVYSRTFSIVACRQGPHPTLLSPLGFLERTSARVTARSHPKPSRVPPTVHCFLHIPSDLVVMPQSFHNTLDISRCYPHDDSSAPTAICTEGDTWDRPHSSGFSGNALIPSRFS